MKEALRELDFDERTLTPEHGRAPHQPLQEPDADSPADVEQAARTPREERIASALLGSTRRSSRPRARSTSTTCCCGWCGCSRRSRRRSRWYRTRLDATCWSTSTRTPTARSTASCSSSPRSTGTSAWWAIPTSRSTAGAARTCATSSTSRRTIPDCRVVALEQNYRSTKRILDIASAVIVNNTAAQGQAAVDREPRGRAGGGLPGVGRERGVRLRGPEDPGPARRGAGLPATSRCSTAPTPSPACWRTPSAARASRT